MEEPLLTRGSAEGFSRPTDLRDIQIRSTIDETMQSLLEETNSKRNRFFTWNPTESISRCWNSTKFCLLFTASATTAAAPDALAMMEASTMLLVYFLAVPDALWVHHHHFHDKTYSFNHSTEDILCFSVLRATTIWISHRFLTIVLYKWQYLIFNILLACISIPYASVKLYAIVHSGWDARHRAPAVAMCALTIFFSVAHVLAAQSIIAWMKRRERLGLPTHAVGRARTYDQLEIEDHNERIAVQDTVLQNDDDNFIIDVEAAATAAAIEKLIDPGVSKFSSQRCEFIGRDLSVHYKIAFPQGQEERIPLPAVDVAVIFIHRFGGGVHSWRQVVQPLADTSGVPVIAFDRPGFGLTSRPLLPVEKEEKSGGENFEMKFANKNKIATTTTAAAAAAVSSPYTMEYSAWLAVQLALDLGLQKAVFIGTGDGALVALMATELAKKSRHTTNKMKNIPAATATGPSAITTLPTGTAAIETSATSIPSNSSLPASLDLTWMGSAAPTDRREILRRLLRGEFTPFDATATATTTAGGGGDGNIDIGGVKDNGPAPHFGANNSIDDAINSEILFFEEETSSFVKAQSVSRHHRPLSRESMMSDVELEVTASPMSSSFSAAVPLTTAATATTTTTAPAAPRMVRTLTVPGIVLVNMDMSGQCGPMHIRVLGSSKLGRHVLRDLLGTEVGDVGNSRAWSSKNSTIDSNIGISSALPPMDVISLYKQYLQVGPHWDAALVEVCRAAGKRRKLSQRRLDMLIESALSGDDDTAVMIVHGGDDVLVKVDGATSVLGKVSACGRKGQLIVLAGCGHLAHEEQPEALVAVLARFVRDVLL